MVRVEGIREVRGTAYTSVQGWGGEERRRERGKVIRAMACAVSCKAAAAAAAAAAAMGIHELPSIKVVCAAFKRCTTFLAVGVGRISTTVIT